MRLHKSAPHEHSRLDESQRDHDTRMAQAERAACGLGSNSGEKQAGYTKGMGNDPHDRLLDSICWHQPMQCDIFVSGVGTRFHLDLAQLPWDFEGV